MVLHEPRVVITNFIADDLRKERRRLEHAITALRADLDAMLEHGDVAEGGEHRDVLEAYRMFAHDRGWVHRLEEAVMTGLTAEAAVERVQSDTRARMLRQTDPYLRERLHDLDDLANRLMRQLLGRDHAPSREHLPENAIIVARSMGPAALLDYDRTRLRGLVLEEGGPTSHVAIVARALGIAAVGEVSNAIGLVDPGDAIIVDGGGAIFTSGPPPTSKPPMPSGCEVRARRQLQYFALRDKPCMTRDGQEVSLFLNAGLLVDLPHIAETGAAGNRPVPHRDCNSWWRRSFRAPASSLRSTAPCSTPPPAGRSPSGRSTSAATRCCLTCATSRRKIPRWGGARSGSASTGRRCCAARLRALLRAASGRELRLMFPMVATVAEFDDAQGPRRSRTDLSAAAQSQAARPGRGRHHGRSAGAALPTRRTAGARRLPVRSAATTCFSSCSQPTAAIPASVHGSMNCPCRCCARCKDIADRAAAHDKPVTLCGEMASRTVGALALIALGYRNLSLVPSAVGPVKAMALELDAGKAKAW